MKYTLLSKSLLIAGFLVSSAITHASSTVLTCTDDFTHEILIVKLDNSSNEGKAEVEFVDLKFEGSFKLGTIGGQTRLAGATSLVVNATNFAPMRVTLQTITINLFGSDQLGGSAKVAHFQGNTFADFLGACKTTLKP